MPVSMPPPELGSSDCGDPGCVDCDRFRSPEQREYLNSLTRCSWCSSRRCVDMACRNCRQCGHRVCQCPRCPNCHSRYCNEEACIRCGYCDEIECTCETCEDCGRIESECVCNEMPDEVQSYSYKPSPVFYGKGPLFMGIELEIETRRARESYRVVERTLGNLVYCKEDSSLSSGFEIVSHPMDHAYAMTEAPWGECLEGLRDSGAYTGDGTGLHIHVNRTAFTGPGHVYRWMKFWYRNSTQMEKMARRQSHWGSFDREGRRAQKAIASKGHLSWEDGFSVPRYNAINALPAATFEVRMFRSTLSLRELLGAMSLTASTVEYARTLTAQAVLKRDGWAWKSYVDFLAQRSEYQPALTEVSRLCAS